MLEEYLILNQMENGDGDRSGYWDLGIGEWWLRIGMTGGGY